jgi:tRNA pseudouridine55 synthase
MTGRPEAAMGRKRWGRAVNGWVILDKPSGMTSFAAVAAVRRALDAAKAGHGGTLDPLATGLLPIALGEATKTLPYIVDSRKAYRFTVRWGEARDTDDSEGRIVATSVHRPEADAIEAALLQFTGVIEQVPPIYSAIKVEGRRAYALARADVPIVLSPRPIVIERIALVAMPDADHAVFDVACGKGAYMRALARDLAVALGTVGHVAALRRTAVGPFTEQDAIALDKVEAVRHSDAVPQQVLPVAAALAGIPALALTEAEARRIQRGQAIAVLPVVGRLPQGVVSKDAVFCAMAENKPIALAQIRGGEVWPLRVLNL